MVEFISAYIPDTTISDVIDLFDHDWKTIQYGLISCLDSSRRKNLKWIFPLCGIEPSSAKFTSLANFGLLLPIDELVEKIVTHPLLSEYDEIAFFRQYPTITEMGDEVHMTSDKPIAGRSEENLELIKRWMESTNCILYVGDGCGLNYATTSSDISRLLSKNSSGIGVAMVDHLREIGVAGAVEGVQRADGKAWSEIEAACD